jgi:two-component system invasion response regulator UvrY
MVRVIIVDDHPVVRRGLKQIIAAERDMQVVGEAENAREALHIVCRTSCDVVVLDITLPDASGLEVLIQLKRDRPTLPVLIMSIHEEELYALRVLKAGASGYLMKNSIPEELIRAIRKITAGGKYISPSLAEKLVSELASPVKPLHEKLSDREFRIMCLIASGKSLKEIGETLCISGKTVSTYRARILDKMHMKTNADLVGYVLQNKLIA